GSKSGRWTVAGASPLSSLISLSSSSSSKRRSTVHRPHFDTNTDQTTTSSVDGAPSAAAHAPSTVHASVPFLDAEPGSHAGPLVLALTTHGQGERPLDLLAEEATSQRVVAVSEAPAAVLSVDLGGQLAVLRAARLVVVQQELPGRVAVQGVLLDGQPASGRLG